jgi:adenylate cyclase
MGLLERVSKALGVMTHHILEQEGVIGDFHGDAAMGFWGWPLPQPDTVARACRAALAIRAAFESASRQAGHPLADFHVGIGVATGRAVAGGIGTIDQLKVTVFGPVVNLASRLEGMTKLIRAPILLDESTARTARQQLPPNAGRMRRVAVVRPYGMDKSLEVSELLPPAGEFPQLTAEHLCSYEAALDAFLAGQWTEALELLHQVPARDRVKDFLTIFIAQHNRTPPPRWDQVIPLESKG